MNAVDITSAEKKEAPALAAEGKGSSEEQPSRVSQITHEQLTDYTSKSNKDDQRETKSIIFSKEDGQDEQKVVSTDEMAAIDATVLKKYLNPEAIDSRKVQDQGDAATGSSTSAVKSSISDIGSKSPSQATSRPITPVPTSRPTSAVPSTGSRPTSAVPTSRPTSAVRTDTVELIIRPVDGEWSMGDDWVVSYPYSKTLNDIKAYIEEEKGISQHRIQLRLKGKIIPSNRENWTVRRYGIYDGYIVQVEPTLTGSWLWHDLDYYAEKLLSEVIEEIRKTECGSIQLSELDGLVKVPPCFPISLRVFLRRYPERIFIHTDTSEDIMWVQEPARPLQLPTFSNINIQIGRFKHYQPPKFNWSNYKDVDDMYQVDDFAALERELMAKELREGGEAALSKFFSSTKNDGGGGGGGGGGQVGQGKSQEELEHEAAAAAGDDDDDGNDDDGEGGGGRDAKATSGGGGGRGRKSGASQNNDGIAGTTAGAAQDITGEDMLAEMTALFDSGGGDAAPSAGAGTGGTAATAASITATATKTTDGSAKGRS